MKRNEQNKLIPETSIDKMIISQLLQAKRSNVSNVQGDNYAFNWCVSANEEGVCRGTATPTEGTVGKSFPIHGWIVWAEGSFEPKAIWEEGEIL